MFLLLADNFCTLKIDVNNLYILHISFVIILKSILPTFLWLAICQSLWDWMNTFIDYLEVIDWHELQLLHNSFNYIKHNFSQISRNKTLLKNWDVNTGYLSKVIL